MRRLLALVLILSLLVLPMPVRAEEPHAIVLACSDFQCFADSDEGDYSGVYTENLAFLQKTMSVMGYDDIDGFLFGGDYNFADTTSSRTKTGTGLTAIRESVCARYPSLTEDDFVMIQGNHDAPDTPGMAQTGPYEFDAYSVYAINEDDYMDSSSSRSTITRTGQALEAWLREKAEAHYDHPIFIASHLPLHFNTRTQRRGDAKYAHALFDPLNEYGKTLNIIFLFGHNHARGYDSYLGGASIFLQRGDTIQLAVSGSKTEYTEETLNFTYMNYGYTGYFWFNYDSEGKGVITDNPPADNALTMTSFEITGNTVTIRRWDENGPHNLKSPGKKITTDINGLDYYDQWDANSITYGPVMQVLPPVVSADLTALAQTIAKAQALTPERYTADSRSAFDEALKAARGCTDAQPQAEIDQACTVLQAAMDGLVLRSAEVEAAIDAIGTVTLDRAAAIEAARTAYDALPPELQAEVKNIEALRLAEQTLQNLQAIDAAEAIIDAIGIVTLDRTKAVQAARTAYDALPPELQAEVKNIEALRLAEQTLHNLQAIDAAEAIIDEIGIVTLDRAEAIQSARTAYDALPPELQAEVKNIEALRLAEQTLQNLQAIDAAETIIDAIGIVTLDRAEAIQSARTALDALPPELQAEVKNIEALRLAEQTLQNLQAIDAAETIIDAIGIVTLDRAEAIEAARTALDALPPELQAEVKNIDTLRLAEQTLQNLQAIDAAEAIIDEIGIVTLDRAEAIEAARTALDALPPELQAEVKNIEALRLAEQTLQNLQAEAALDCHGDSDACVSARFTDVPPYSNWAHSGIDYCVGKGLFDGTGASTFSPKQTMTRAMLVTVLWRCAGQPEAVPCDFQDVEPGRWYTAAIAWAAENGIVNGTAPGKFDPNAPVTRQQLAAILYRYDGAQAADFDLSPIPDAKEISTYAIPAIRWALSKGILTGSSVNGTRYLLPKSGATREQVAAMLMRYLKSNTKSVQKPTKYDE